jgi:hypothetical protein
VWRHRPLKRLDDTDGRKVHLRFIEWARRYGGPLKHSLITLSNLCVESLGQRGDEGKLRLDGLFRTAGLHASGTETAAAHQLVDAHKMAMP